jgi:serine/threonine protein kinase/predicted negative regulator of RcsB-dependent stress response
VPRPSDRNLLFGILALQMDFVAKTALIEGMQAWLLDKDKPLGELLCERGALTSENRGLLEPLVDAHVRQHGGDAQNSLAALSSDGGLQASLRQVNDSDIQGSLSLLPQPEPPLPPEVGFLSSAALPVKADGADLELDGKLQADGQIAPKPIDQVGDDRPAGDSSPAVPTDARDQETLIPGTLDQLDEPKMRFRILRPHAEGGLGRVHVALDQELNREVAFKEIKFEYARRRDAQSRFVVEAEVTGGLEHPGIVPVYGLGHFPDGRPFYAMRFIRGQSLHEAIREFYQENGESDENHNAVHDERRNVDATHDSNSIPASAATSVSAINSARANSSNLEFRNLINRLIDVCNAIQYAHDRQVLHRDLKPGNIMLGKYGETLVVDWGLAKATGSDNPLERSTDGELPIVPASGSQSAPTQMGSAIGTPAYMPPEQAAGHLDQLGPASDVYSLGATLYEILTGQPPLKGLRIAELLKRVQSGDIPTARQLSPEIPPTLNAVCRKAMALSPTDRYASAASLADDLEAWLADEPVAAFSESLLVRARRWNRRHPALVSATAVSVLLAVVGLTTFSGVLAGKNEQLTASLVREQDTTRKAEDNERRAIVGEKLAKANAQRAIEGEKLAKTNETRALAGEELARKNAEVATAQSGLALNTLTGVVFDLQRSLKNVLGGAEVRQRLLTSVLPQLEQISTEFASQSAVDRNTMVALMAVAETVLQIGSAGQPGSLRGEDEQSLGNLQTDRSATTVAERLCQRAHEIAQQLVIAAPNDTLAQRDLCTSYESLGVVFLKLGRTDEALMQFEAGLKIHRTLAEADPSDTQKQRELAVSLDQRGYVFLKRGRTDDALVQFEDGLKIRRTLAAADPSDAQKQRDLSISFNRLGDAFLKLGRTDDALVQFEDALEIRRPLAEADPSDVQKQSDLAFSFERLGDVSLALGKTEEALKYFTDELEIAKRWMKADPADVDAKRFTSVAYNKLGGVFLELDRTDDALVHFEDAFRVRRTLAEADPSNMQKQRDLAVLIHNLGAVFLKLDRTDDALTQFETYQKISHTLAAADPSDAQKQRDLSISYASLGDVFLKLGRTDDALTQYEDVLEIRRTQAEADPSDTQKQRDLSISYASLGDMFLKLGRTDDALKQFKGGLRISRTLAEADPSDTQKQRNLAVSLERLGDASLESGKTEEALKYFTDELEIAEKRMKADPANVDALRFTTVVHNKLGDVFVTLGRTDDALTQYEDVLKIRRTLAEADSSDTQKRRDLMVSYYKLGEFHRGEQQFDKAIDQYQLGTTVLEHMIQADQNVDTARKEIGILQRRIKVCKHNFTAGGDWGELLKQSADRLPELITTRCTLLARQKRLVDIAQAAAKLQELAPAAEPGTASRQKGGMLYNTSCGYGM